MAEHIERAIGKLEGSLNGLSNTVAQLEEQVMGLRDDLNQRRGAKKTFFLMCGVFSSLGGFCGSYLKSKFGL